jgi:predicted ABC-type ATPase
MTIYEVATAMAVGVFCIVLIWFIIESNQYISERNRLRKETGKYYEHDIHEELLKRAKENKENK